MDDIDYATIEIDFAAGFTCFVENRYLDTLTYLESGVRRSFEYRDGYEAAQADARNTNSLYRPLTVAVATSRYMQTKYNEAAGYYYAYAD